MNILIADDEQLARARLRALVADLGEPYVVAGEAATGDEAVAICEADGIDLVLMDIRMPGMDGMAAAAALARMASPPAVVFVTAFDEHALEAFEREAVDYLLKPVRKERLQKALEKACIPNRIQRQVREGTDGVAARGHVSAVISGEIRTVPIEEVRYFRADQKYVTAVHDNGELLLEDSLKSLEQEFANRFIRIHRNAIVATAHIAGMVRDDDGNPALRIRGSDERLDISRRHLPQVRRWLKEGR